ncbi:MAG TPA: FG-GAP-like repeat-containing protein [Edaphobacter sp.]|nr:FG-GAP-like repeat-containing protein [Edaphobacter sp.]
MHSYRSYILAASLILFTSSASQGQSPSFAPDSTFSGSSLAGWNTIGHAAWSAKDGQILANVGTNKGNGWLILNHSYQDTGVYLSFRCKNGCDTGVLLRAEKTSEGMKGIFLSIKGDELAAYRVSLDTEGKEVNREKLRPAGGLIRFAPPPPPPSAPERHFTMPKAIDAPPGVTLPLQRPAPGLKKDEWNDVEILLDADILRAFFDDGSAQVSVATDEMDGYGPIALYAGGGKEVSFRDFSLKDLAMKDQPLEKVGGGFRMQRVNPFYYGWSAAAADFNRDGKLDIVSGPFIYYGPEFTRSREIYPAQIVNASTGFSMEDWVEHAYDFTGDGWPDVLTTSHADGGKVGAVLYVNPKGESRRWQKFTVVVPIQSEATILKDIDGDGKPELIYEADGYMRYAKPDPKNPTGKWIVHTISEHGPWPAHGIGAGDVNGDGRIDILGAYGWWEQPAQLDDHVLWKYHPEPFGRWGRTSAGGGEIGVYDVNGDGLNDVVTTLQAHGWGLAWFEQKRSATGEISFIKHMVMGRTRAESAGGVVFTEPHGTAIADMDGDGIPDFIVGKRYWSHLDDYYDPDPYGAPVLYWYKTVRDPKAPGGARMVPELIHNWSGAGSDVLVTDLNGDGIKDVVTSTRSGTYIFWGKPRK